MTSINYKTVHSEDTVELCPPDKFTVGYVRHLAFCVDVGLVARAQKVMGIVSRYDLGTLPELATILSRANDWLPGALEFESVHGAGSMLDVKHPRYLETSKRLAVRLASKSEAVAH